MFYSGIIPKGAALRHRQLTSDFPARFPGRDKAFEQETGKLTKTQERRRIEGLRILARIIARHYLAHPELYPEPREDGDGTEPSVNGHAVDSGEGKAGGKDGKSWPVSAKPRG